MFFWVQRNRILRGCGRGDQEIGENRKKKCGHYPGEMNFGERAKVIKEDFEEELSAKYILAVLLEFKCFF